MSENRPSFSRRMRAHPFVRQISGVMALTATGQGLYMLAGPFIGRLYSPAEVGYFGLFVTVWTVLALFACGLYDLAIPGARNEHEARRLSSVSVGLGILIAMGCGAGVSLIAAHDWFGFGVFPIWAGAVMTAGMLAQTAVLVGQAWAIRRDRIMAIGRANVLMNGVRSVLQVVGGFALPLWGTMMAGEIVARLAQAWQMLKGPRERWAIFSWRGARETIVHNRRFPIVFGPAFLLDIVGALIQTAMIGWYFGAADMGQYFLMRRTLDLPVAFAFRSLSDSFLARQLALSREAPHRLRPFFLRSALLLAVVGLVASLPLLVWGEELFRIFYGANWGPAGGLAAIMVPAMVLNLAVAPVSRIFQLTRMAHLRLLPGAVSVIGSLLVLGLASHYRLDLPATVAGISAAICLQYFVYFASGYYVAGHTGKVAHETAP